MKKLLSLSLLASVAVAAAVVAPAPRVEAQIIAQLPPGGVSLSIVPITIACKNPGSSQDVAKTPVLTNSTSHPIAKGKTLTWKSSDGDGGSLKLDADLLPGASIKAMGKAGNGYTCSSTYLANPDLTVTNAMPSSSGYVVKVQNLDKHAWAPASTVRIDFLSCSGGAVVATAQGKVDSLFAGGSASVVVATPKPLKTYIRVTADAAKQVVEGNEGNNVWTESMNGCLY
jgi:hypothetical protein